MTDLKVPSRIAMVVGLGMIIGGVIRIATAPHELPMRAPGWFESAEAHGHAIFLGAALLMFGFFVLSVGFLLSQRVRKAALGLTQDTAAAIARGLGAAQSSDPKARLEQLEKLRRDNLITEGEYEAKRKAILDNL